MIKRWAYKQIVSTGVHGEQPRSRAPSMRAANTSHNGEHCIAGFYMHPEQLCHPTYTNGVAVDKPVAHCANVRRRLACIVDSP